jgi:hypothetical protein
MVFQLIGSDRPLDAHLPLAGIPRMNSEVGQIVAIFWTA